MTNNTNQYSVQRYLQEQSKNYGKEKPSQKVLTVKAGFNISKIFAFIKDHSYKY